MILPILLIAAFAAGAISLAAAVAVADVIIRRRRGLKTDAQVTAALDEFRRDAWPAPLPQADDDPALDTWQPAAALAEWRATHGMVQP